MQFLQAILLQYKFCTDAEEVNEQSQLILDSRRLLKLTMQVSIQKLKHAQLFLELASVTDYV